MTDVLSPADLREIAEQAVALADGLRRDLAAEREAHAATARRLDRLVAETELRKAPSAVRVLEHNGGFRVRWKAGGGPKHADYPGPTREIARGLADRFADSLRADAAARRTQWARPAGVAP